MLVLGGRGGWELQLRFGYIVGPLDEFFQQPTKKTLGKSRGGRGRTSGLENGIQKPHRGFVRISEVTEVNNQ